MALTSRSACRDNHKTIIHRIAEILFATEIPLCSLHGDVTEQELYLFQFAAARVA
jgi:hypothetical protein